jgi:hypothetical protein
LRTEQNSKRDGKDRDDLQIETVPISQQQQRKYQIKEQFRRNAPRNAIQIRYPVVYRQPALQQQELGHQTGATTPTRWVAAHLNSHMKKQSGNRKTDNVQWP